MSFLSFDLLFCRGLLVRMLGFVALSLIILLSSLGEAKGASRLKDIADIEGLRDNPLVGYGLVVGLNGSGDSLRNSPFTRQSLEAMLEQMGINTRDADLNTKNVAAVMVTAELPPFKTQGTRIDVIISTLGDASSLLGGQLLVTPLRGADGEVYAVAQGAVTAGGFAAEGDGASVARGVPTSGRIANGAIVEREINFSLEKMRELKLALRNPDLTTARRVAQAVNTLYGSGIARPLAPTNVKVSLPADYKGGMIAFLTDIEQLRVEPDQPAQVVINEASGIIVMGKDVRISTVAIAQGNLTIRITERPQVSQPSPFSETGETVVVPRTEIEIDDKAERKLAVLEDGVTLEKLVQGLNALGVGPRDMVEILQSVKAAGALQADLIVH